MRGPSLDPAIVRLSGELVNVWRGMAMRLPVRPGGHGTKRKDRQVFNSGAPIRSSSFRWKCPLITGSASPELFSNRRRWRGKQILGYKPDNLRGSFHDDRRADRCRMKNEHLAVCAAWSHALLVELGEPHGRHNPGRHYQLTERRTEWRG